MSEMIPCEACGSKFKDDLIEKTICVSNGNNDENELNNYDLKTILVCCICVAHQRYESLLGLEE